MMKRIFLSITIALIFIAFITYFIGVRFSTETKVEPVLTSVIVKTIEPQTMRLWTEFSGRLEAVDSVEIRPEVSGRITEVRFEDGGMVKAGDILFVIDPRPYEAAVSRAEAKVTTALSNAEFAAVEMKRATTMIKTQAIAQRIYDERFNTNQSAEAAIKSAEAELKQANVDLEHAYVRSPISGRVGRVEITLGNSVQSGPNAPLMTRVISQDPIYSDFEVDEQTYLESVRSVASVRHLEQQIPVELLIQGDVYKGTIYTFDNRLDPLSGTIRARAKFSNSDGVLIPGMFVTVRLGSRQEKSFLMVPQQAIGSDQSKKYVFVVNKDNKVEYRSVEVGKEIGSQRIVFKGISTGERVIVKGIQHIKSGETVSVKEENTNDG